MAGTIIRRALDTFRAEGLRGVWRKTQSRFSWLYKRLSMKPVYRRALVMWLPLTDDLPIIEPKIPVTFEELTESAFDELISVRPYLTKERILLRLEAGHRCYVARFNGRIVHSRFVAVEKAYAIYLRTAIPLSPHEVYFYDAYTVPEYRGNGICPAVARFVGGEMRQLGYRQAVAFILPDNHPSLRVWFKLGGQKKGYIGFVELFGARRYFYRVKDRGFACLDNVFFAPRDSFVPRELQGQIW